MPRTSIGIFFQKCFSAIFLLNLSTAFTRNAVNKTSSYYHRSFTLLLCLLLHSSFSQASLPFYLLRSTLAPDHEQTQIELKSFLSSRDVYLHTDSCGHGKNNLMASSDSGQMVCIKRYPGVRNELRGELYSYHFSQLLGTYNVPAIVITKLSYSDPFWAPHRSMLEKLSWHEGNLLVVSQYYQGLSDAYLPEALKSKEGLRQTALKQEQISPMLQWSHLIVLDYLTGENDRLVSTLVNLEQNSSMFSYPVHNLGWLLMDSGELSKQHSQKTG